MTPLVYLLYNLSSLLCITCVERIIFLLDDPLWQQTSDKARRIDALKVSMEEEEGQGQEGLDPDKAARLAALKASMEPSEQPGVPMSGSAKLSKMRAQQRQFSKAKRSFPPAVISPLGSALGLFSATFGRHGVCVCD
jgi:hypothetical protein